MRSNLLTSFLVLALLTLLTGGFYPHLVTRAARALCPGRARGSLIEAGGRLVGSELLGQPCSDPAYFWGRPSATSPPGNAARSGGSNLGPSHPALADSIRVRVERLRQWDPETELPVPVDLVTASASGLDPHISPAAAFYQVPRVARLRGLDPGVLDGLVRRQIEGRSLGFLGEPRVNVLRLNLALDALSSGR